MYRKFIGTKELKRIAKRVEFWSAQKVAGIFVFNVLVALMLLLSGAGYFDPFFLLSINNVVLISMILTIFLLGARSRTFFFLALAFWAVSAFFGVFGIAIWSERASIYVFQALVIGVLLVIFEAKDDQNA